MERKRRPDHAEILPGLYGRAGRVIPPPSPAPEHIDALCQITASFVPHPAGPGGILTVEEAESPIEWLRGAHVRIEDFMADRRFSDAQVSALARGFFALGRGADGAPPRPNAVSQWIDRQIDRGAMSYTNGTLTVLPRNRAVLIRQLTEFFEHNAIEVPNKEVLFHHRNPTSAIRAAFADLSTIVVDDTIAVCLEQRVAQAVADRITAVYAETKVTDPNIRFCYKELRQIGAGVFGQSNEGITLTVPTPDLRDRARAIIANGARPSEERVKALAERILDQGVGLVTLDLPGNTTRDELVTELRGRTRWDLQMLDARVNEIVAVAKREALPTRETNGRPKDANAALSEEAERRSSRTFTGGSTSDIDRDLSARIQKSNSSIEKSFLGALAWVERQRDPSTAEPGLADGLFRSRVEFHPGQKYIPDRAVEISGLRVGESTPRPVPPEKRSDLYNGERFTAKIQHFFPHHVVMADGAGRFAVLETSAIISHVVGVRGTRKDGPPRRDQISGAERVDIPVTICVTPEGLTYYSENPRTVEKREAAKSAEPSEIHDGVDVENDLGRERIWLAEYARNVLSHSHDIPPEAITVQLANAPKEKDRVEEGVPYRGVIVGVGQGYFAQAVGKHIIIHEVAAFERVPAVGEKWEITYEPGMDLSQATGKVLPSRDVRVIDFVTRALPSIESDGYLQEQREAQLGVAITMLANQLDVPPREIGIVTPDRGMLAHFTGQVVHAGTLFSFAHMALEEGQKPSLLVLDHTRLGRSFDRSDVVTIGTHETGLNVANVERAEDQIERKRDRDISAMLADRQEAIERAKERVEVAEVARRLSIEPSQVRFERPDREVEAGLVLVTDASAIFAYEKDGEALFYRTPSHELETVQTSGPDRESRRARDQRFNVSKEIAANLASVEAKRQENKARNLRPEVAASMNVQSVTLAPGTKGEVLIMPGEREAVQQHELHNFRLLRGRMTEEVRYEGDRNNSRVADVTARYTGDRYSGRIADVTKHNVIVDVGHFDLIPLDRGDGLQAREDALELDTPVEVLFQDQHVEIERTDRSLAMESERGLSLGDGDRDDRSNGGLTR